MYPKDMKMLKKLLNCFLDLYNTNLHIIGKKLVVKRLSQPVHSPSFVHFTTCCQWWQVPQSSLGMVSMEAFHFYSLVNNHISLEEHGIFFEILYGVENQSSSKVGVHQAILLFTRSECQIDYCREVGPGDDLHQNVLYCA